MQGLLAKKHEFTNDEIETIQARVASELGFKLVDKNLLKSQRLISSKSHLTVKLLIDNLVKKGRIKSLIQIGANDGLRFDVLNKYIKEYKELLYQS